MACCGKAQGLFARAQAATGASPARRALAGRSAAGQLEDFVRRRSAQRPISMIARAVAAGTGAATGQIVPYRGHVEGVRRYIAEMRVWLENYLRTFQEMGLTQTWLRSYAQQTSCTPSGSSPASWYRCIAEGMELTSRTISPPDDQASAELRAEAARLRTIASTLPGASVEEAPSARVRVTIPNWGVNIHERPDPNSPYVFYPDGTELLAYEGVFQAPGDSVQWWHVRTLDGSRHGYVRMLAPDGYPHVTITEWIPTTFRRDPSGLPRMDPIPAEMPGPFNRSPTGLPRLPPAG